MFPDNAGTNFPPDWSDLGSVYKTLDDYSDPVEVSYGRPGVLGQSKPTHLLRWLLIPIALWLVFVGGYFTVKTALMADGIAHSAMQHKAHKH